MNINYKKTKNSHKGQTKVICTECGMGKDEENSLLVGSMDGKEEIDIKDVKCRCGKKSLIERKF